ncbi:hypothetical protein DPMN_172841 [Dreissena polymorpha]|uniref:Uncharacterized protein n=1 Tax=Dreissena polymorpha TaxID=45954 RepID=A0A9D4E0I6_DREPO|nr:hypothetical protein DPMN_172841 [Dreissena polymorpha]
MEYIFQTAVATVVPSIYFGAAAVVAAVVVVAAAVEAAEEAAAVAAAVVAAVVVVAAAVVVENRFQRSAHINYTSMFPVILLTLKQYALM